ncbi:MAG: DUF296 domain-containing protein [Deltaproteobacteria bacterium]|nr:DUF296 domain-containing protein [Deltaproteobacteria bacterium]MCB9478252.1 DUF296 domain-containing protein [Deltaproteobacteria bacterium]MCB9487195.1 DUF296 domain-containing protein [Deltaproteobacteria bacterium]
MKTYEAKSGRVIVGRLERDEDLVGALLQVARQYDLKCAEVRALGAVTEAKVTEWDDVARAYRTPAVHRVGLMEVLMLYGNLSSKEGELFWHLHLTAGFMQAGETNMVAGHLLSATVYALEFVIRELDGVDLVRVPDAATGLMLWE